MSDHNAVSESVNKSRRSTVGQRIAGARPTTYVVRVRARNQLQVVRPFFYQGPSHLGELENVIIARDGVSKNQMRRHLISEKLRLQPFIQDRWRNDKRPKEQETLRRRGTVHLLACIGSMAVSAHTLIPLSPARFAVLWSDLDATTASNKYRYPGNHRHCTYAFVRFFGEKSSASPIISSRKSRPLGLRVPLLT